MWKRPIDAVFNEINRSMFGPLPHAVPLLAGVWLAIRAVRRREFHSKITLQVSAQLLWSPRPLQSPFRQNHCLDLLLDDDEGYPCFMPEVAHDFMITNNVAEKDILPPSFSPKSSIAQ